MTQLECETLILQKLIEIREIAKMYMEREPEYLGAYIGVSEGSKTMWIHNRQWTDGEDKDKPIRVWKKEML